MTMSKGDMFDPDVIGPRNKCSDFRVSGQEGEFHVLREQSVKLRFPHQMGKL